MLYIKGKWGNLDLRRAVEAYTRENHISGVLCVTLKDKILHKQNMDYAARERRIPFDKDSAFTFYALSKLFCVIGFDAFSGK